MKNIICLIAVIFLITGFSFPATAEDGTGGLTITSVCIKGGPVFTAKHAGSNGAGGIWPAIQSCCFGPRIGLEANEGKPVKTEEVLDFILFRHWGLLVGFELGVKVALDVNFPFWGVIVPVMAAKDNGADGFFASMFLGPRVGMEIKRRHVRIREWLNLVPLVNLFTRFSIAMEAYNGFTMKEIEQEESLERVY